MMTYSDSFLVSDDYRYNHESILDDIDSISSQLVMNSTDACAHREPVIVGDDHLGFSSTADVDSSRDSENIDIIREVLSDDSSDNRESSSDGGIDQLFICPSFNSYTENIVESASRAASQLDSSPEFLGFDDSFQFSMLQSSSTPSDNVFSFPLFDYNSAIDVYRNRDSSFPSPDTSINPNSSNPATDSIRNPNSSIPATNSVKNPKPDDDELDSIRVTLKQLIYSNHNANPSPSSSSSSSESEEDLEELAKGPYCTWKPKTSIAIEESRNRCRKSKSTGSPCKQWILSGLLSRSCSDGSKNRANVTVTRVTDPVKRGDEGRRRSIGAERSSGNKTKGERVNMSPHEVMYVLNRAEREEKKRRSFLPYKPTLVGFFSKVR